MFNSASRPIERLIRGRSMSERAARSLTVHGADQNGCELPIVTVLSNVCSRCVFLKAPFRDYLLPISSEVI